LIVREDIEAREQAQLAPYAAKSAESRGRVYPQAEHPLRTAYQRDRDRVVHSAAFRRMEYKTQVFLPHEADHFRTRLTHTIEVAQISRTLARNLQLNEDLTEAIALVHDLGHTPFGHAGEDALDELLRDRGGFNHNRQSLRIVEGIVKHDTRARIVTDEFHPDERPTLEAALVDMADELTYSAHDVDDGINSGLLSSTDIMALDIWKNSEHPASLKNGRATVSPDSDDTRHRLVRFLVNTTATDLLEETSRQLDLQQIGDLDSLRRSGEPVCRYSERLADKVEQLTAFLRERLYFHPKLLALSQQAKETVSFLYEQLMARPDQMPPRFQAMLEHEDRAVVVSDYIAGMTDRYAENLKQRLG
jgi:dGTPase